MSTHLSAEISCGSGVYGAAEDWRGKALAFGHFDLQRNSLFADEPGPDAHTGEIRIAAGDRVSEAAVAGGSQ